MTVCVAAVCNIGPDRPTFVVAASDRMITIGDIEYEPEQTKAVEFGTSTVGLLAGDMQVHAAIVPKTLVRLRQLVADRHPHRLTVEEIAETYAKEFAYYRRTLAEREILMPRGWDFERFARLQTTLPHYQVQELDARLVAHGLAASAIIAGLDHTGAHLYKVRDPGVAESFNTPFFACIGSGSDIATTQFMLAKYEKRWSLSKALWLTFSAKARAEVAGGVGPQTDLIVIGPNRFTYAGEEQKRELYKLFERVIEKEKAAQDEAIEVLEHFLGVATAPQAPQAASQDVGSEGAEEQPPRDALLPEPISPASPSEKKASRGKRRSGPPPT
jgi:20S proteasome alpha/beta subunit